MKMFLVGGAVRDRLLGKEPKDLDFVLVGADEAQLMGRFPSAVKQGASFPVYRVEGLGEVALARRERKVAAGHNGFEVDFGPEVTLEEDLSRRDLTINAMALDVETGVLVDPFDGQRDLQDRVLRHVSPAFAEDPLRVYRVARFASQLGFSVSPDTLALMRSLANELATLSVERVVEEMKKALCSPHPARFFEALAEADCLSTHFEELEALRSVPAGPPKHHAEGDAFRHTMMVLEATVDLGADEMRRFSALVHDLGKGVTPKESLPSHHDHEERGVELVERLGDRLKLPASFVEAGKLASAEHLRVHRFSELRPGSKVDLVVRAERNPLRPEGLAMVAMADALGRVPSRSGDGPRALLRAAELVRSVTARGLGLPTPQCSGAAVGARLRQARAELLAREMPR